MGVLVFLALFLSFTGYSSAQYCVCKGGSQDTGPNGPYQKVIDYACSAGASCSAILQSGACYQPNDVKSHCDYAANSYYQNKKSQGATCDFGGVASLTNSPPPGATGSCSYPTSGSPGSTGTSTGGTGTGGMPTPGSSTTGGVNTGGMNTGPPGSTNSIFSPTGFGPTGSMTDTGPSGAWSLQQTGSLVSLSLTLFLGLLILWG